MHQITTVEHNTTADISLQEELNVGEEGRPVISHDPILPPYLLLSLPLGICSRGVIYRSWEILGHTKQL
jgi:hypothetical protein